MKLFLLRRGYVLIVYTCIIKALSDLF